MKIVIIEINILAFLSQWHIEMVSRILGRFTKMVGALTRSTYYNREFSTVSLDEKDG